MDENQFVTFKKFNDPESAAELTAVLEENNIKFLFDGSGNFDPTFSNSELNKEYRIKLRKDDFEKANILLLEITTKQLETVDKEYYLFDFSDEELLEIISKPDEWSQYDYVLSQRILKERGNEILSARSESLLKNRLDELAKPESISPGWINARYISALGGGLPAVFTGWHLMTYKKTLPNGETVYGFTPEDRVHGKRIFKVGLICSAIFLIVYVIYKKDY